MTNTLPDTTAIVEIFPWNIIDSFATLTHTGLLSLDGNFKIIAVNSYYQQFHRLFHHSALDKEKILTESELDSYPQEFSSVLKKFLHSKTGAGTWSIEVFSEKGCRFSVSFNKAREEGRVHEILILVRESKLRQPTDSTSQNNELFKLLVETSPTACLLADEALFFTYASSSIYKILGYHPSEIVGRNALDLIHTDDQDRVRECLNKVRTTSQHQATIEYRARNMDGKYIWVENNARNMLANDSVAAIVMNVRDIQVKKVADEALGSAEQRLSLLLNNTEESFILLSSRLRIVTYNKAAQERSPFFYNTELQSGISLLDIVAKDEIPEYIHLFEQVFNGREIEQESKFVDNAGTWHIYNHTYRPMLDPAGDIQGVVITSTEITDRKKLMEEVALQADMLKTAQTIARLGYLEFDLVTRTFFCSDIFYEVFGLTDRLASWEQLSKLTDSIYYKDRERVKKKIRSSYLKGHEINFEFRFNSQGSTRVILAMGGCEKTEDGSTNRLRITLQDITESKKAFFAMQTLESKFKSLFENSIDGVLLTNEKGRIVSANPSICKMLGYAANELENRQGFELIDAASPEVATMLPRQNDQGATLVELSLKHKNGYFVSAEVSSVCMKDGSGKSYLSTIIRDITEKKKIELEQKALTEELLKNNQDLQQFSFITSHNLRAPVANLVSLLSLYNKENPLDEFNQLLIEKFEEATQQLNQTLNDLVNVLVIKSNPNSQRETISLSEVFENIKAKIESLLDEKNGSIAADFSKVDSIRYTRNHLESIFLNMISNSIRYSVPGRPPEITITSVKCKDWIMVQFADNGLGIDLKRYGDRLFGLYQRFHGHKEGKGLGLYMTRAQVMAMGGKIEVESEPGEGSRFKIYFKLHD